MNAVRPQVEIPLTAAAAVVDQLDQIPFAPKVLPCLMQLLEDGDASLQTVVSLVRLDPGVASRVLRMANSICFNAGAPVASLEEAVVRIGYESIYQFVSSAAASCVLACPLVVYGIDAEDQWRRSIACALAAEALAWDCGENPAEAYTIGLLHGVGMVAINDWALQRPPVLVFTYKGLPTEYVESERALVGATQAEVGAELFERWAFPARMAGPVRWQYAPRSSAAYGRSAALLHAAKWIRSLVCDDGPSLPFPDSYAIGALRLSQARLMEVAGQVRWRMLAVRHLLELRQYPRVLMPPTL